MNWNAIGFLEIIPDFVIRLSYVVLTLLRLYLHCWVYFDFQAIRQTDRQTSSCCCMLAVVDDKLSSLSPSPSLSRSWSFLSCWIVPGGREDDARWPRKRESQLQLHEWPGILDFLRPGRDRRPPHLVERSLQRVQRALGLDADQCGAQRHLILVLALGTKISFARCFVR